MSVLLQNLEEVGGEDAARVGGKAARLGQLLGAGHRVPPGWVLTTSAYDLYVRDAGLRAVLSMELGRKDLATMRWEELWDSALRIRTAFERAPLPLAVEEALRSADLPHAPLAVRSSAPAEDSAGRSFAGLHASVLDVQGADAVLRAVRAVWASLWSDAALLYRRELGLDPLRSRMAVVIQAQRSADCSGVAFGLDPRDPEADRVVIEAVGGSCAGLVDGTRDPDHYELERSSGRLVLERRGSDSPPHPRLMAQDLDRLRNLLGRIERLTGWPADVEWTGRDDQLTVLQARPAAQARLPEDERQKYLGYRPAAARLGALAQEVSESLIPELIAEGARLAKEEVEALADPELADAIEERSASLEHWRAVYAEAFIPFAHGVRALGTYYAEAVRPAEPHEFVGLLRGERFLAGHRNAVLGDLAEFLESHPATRSSLRGCLEEAPSTWKSVLGLLRGADAAGLADRLEELLDGPLDVVYGDVRLVTRPDLLLAPLLEPGLPARPAARTGPGRSELEARLLGAVGAEREAQAREVLRVARLAWRLRDDDNLLLGRIESQLLRAVEAATHRLRARCLLRGGAPRLDDAASVAKALRAGAPLDLARPAARAAPASSGRPRQLVGQPASPGLARGLARCVRSAADLALFRPGEVLVCDAIEPQMTHLVPLARAVVERRGGMLIHGAIIARELGLPCVNGVAGAVELLASGDLLTVDGDLGVVTVGPAEFELELELLSPSG